MAENLTKLLEQQVVRDVLTSVVSALASRGVDIVIDAILDSDSKKIGRTIDVQPTEIATIEKPSYVVNTKTGQLGLNKNGIIQGFGKKGTLLKMKRNPTSWEKISDDEFVERRNKI